MASLSKRAQARNERELHDLLRLPGNSTCADCGARNPAWASWNLGIFLCMRCASIHRKLGTHISKVKSLSMDTWTAEQVENMKTIGNTASNNTYNPKNRKPDMPFDSDEADSAMERFIRKKYQEKSLVDGKPEPPSRLALPPPPLESPQPSPQMQTPSKKHKIFGFGFRASKKDKVGAQTEAPYKITPVEYSPTTGRTKDMTDREMQEKLAQLQDMGFLNNEQNLDVLTRAGGDVEKTISMLVKLGPRAPPRKTSANQASELKSTSATAAAPAALTTGTSNNPYQQQTSSSFGLSFDAAPAQSKQDTSPSTNPWQSAISQQQQQQQRSQPQPQTTGIEQQFSTMQVSQPLFPHNTGGYPVSSQYRPDFRNQAVSPPVPTLPQQYGVMASPSTSSASNPFFQAPMSSQSTGNNPFFQQQQQQQTAFTPGFPSPSTAFMNTPQPFNPSTSSTMALNTMNPFGLSSAPSPQLPQFSPQHQYAQSSHPFAMSQPSSQQLQQASPYTQQQQPQQVVGMPSRQASAQFPDYDYGQTQPMSQPHQQQVYQPQQTGFYQNQQQQASYQPQALTAQQTGRYTKNDIMALFSSPQPQAPQLLASIPEPREMPIQDHFQPPAQELSPSPSNPFAASMNAQSKRSVTSPAAFSNMYSSGGGGSRNPFLSDNTSNASPFPGQLQQPDGAQGFNTGMRHASNESVSVNHPSLMDGRHSPDAFASLSSGYRS